MPWSLSIYSLLCVVRLLKGEGLIIWKTLDKLLGGKAEWDFVVL